MNASLSLSLSPCVCVCVCLGTGQSVSAVGTYTEDESVASGNRAYTFLFLLFPCIYILFKKKKLYLLRGLWDSL